MSTEAVVPFKAMPMLEMLILLLRAIVWVGRIDCSSVEHDESDKVSDNKTWCLDGTQNTKMMGLSLSENGFTHIDGAKETKRCRNATQRQLLIYIASGPVGCRTGKEPWGG